jgi:hypothetical protein
MAAAKKERVALSTCVEPGNGEMFWEEGGVYTTRPVNPTSEVSRPFNGDEHVARCPRCGQRFVATESSSAEKNRDLHYYGDDVPSVCAEATEGN